MPLNDLANICFHSLNSSISEIGDFLKDSAFAKCEAMDLEVSVFALSNELLAISFSRLDNTVQTSLSNNVTTTYCGRLSAHCDGDCTDFVIERIEEYRQSSAGESEDMLMRLTRQFVDNLDMRATDDIAHFSGLAAIAGILMNAQKELLNTLHTEVRIVNP